MKAILIIMPVLLNIWIVLLQVDSVFPSLLAALVVGLYKGNRIGPDIKNIFNIGKVNYSLKNPVRIVELTSATLLSLSTDILSLVHFFKDGLSSDEFIFFSITLGYSVIFGFILFRFLFLYILQDHSKESL
ncbi:hypothetical protein [Niallia taxi]|uniref:Uncharacterized protein n=1 Tax=Niallia taxi TaxID=2499688 RepID=A0A3S2TSW8_9BACI|nr:hypothetical protein [Niallia taxi]MCM3213259.1 hypothetical protein [Niallia taxi]MED4035933.1 hypothetical protein [Niallia taxi]RVT60189.1 hypothetical protein EM808_17230 [Niallia taxi]